MKSYRAVLSMAAATAVALAVAGCAGGASGGGGDESDDGLGLFKAGDLTICANVETPPNIYVDDDGKTIGVEVDIANAIADQLGLTTKILEYDFAGLIPALQAHQCDTIISTLYIKPEREEIANFVPYLISGTGVAVSKENPANVTGYDDSLCGTKAIGINGSTGAVLLEDKSAECEENGLPKIEITYLDSPADALQQVIAGQVDVFVDASEELTYFEAQSDGAFVPVGDVVDTIRIGAATLKDNAPLHEALQGAFEAIVEDGTYADILATWKFEALDIANWTE
jgi:polar amino acid transport system substrate-binding protein